MICIISPMYEILIKINQWKYMDIVKSCFNFQMKIKINYFPKYTFIRHSHSSVSRDNFCNFSRAGLFKVLKSVKNKKKKNKIIKKDSDSLYHRKIARLKSSPLSSYISWKIFSRDDNFGPVSQRSTFDLRATSHFPSKVI